MRLAPKTPIQLQNAEKPDAVLLELEAKHGSSFAAGLAQEMDSDMLRCLLWLLLHRSGGEITFTLKDLQGIPLKGELLLTDSRDEMTLKAIVSNS